MAEEQYGKAPVIPGALENRPAPKEIVSEEHARQVAELSKLIAESKELVDAAKTSREANAELEGRMDRQLEQIKQAAAKNVSLEDDGTSAIGRSGVTWDDVMRLRTRNPEIVEAQNLHNQVMDRAIILAMRSGLVSGVEEGAEKIARRLPTELWNQVEAAPEYRDLRTRRALAAGTWWDIATATGGANWRPVGFSQTAVDFYFLDADIPRVFQQVNIPQGVGNFSIPVESSRGQAIIEANDTNPSALFLNTGIFMQPTTAVATFIPKKHGLGNGAEVSAVEDLAVDVLGRMRMNVTNAMPRALTQSIINAQVLNTGFDVLPAASGFHSANGYANATGQNGLRGHCITNAFTTSIAGANIAALDVLAAREACGDFGAREDEGVLITSGKGYLGLLQDPNVLTVDKMGPNASILRGQLAAVVGVPVMFTSDFPSSLTTGGLANGTGATTGAIYVNHRRWFVATKREIEVTLLPQVGMDKINVIGRMRTDFLAAISTEHSAHYLINVG